MAISAAQDAVFSASNSGSSMSDFGFVIVSMVSALIFLWAAWSISSTAKAWASEKVDLYVVLWVTARVAILITVVGYWVRP